MDESIIIDSAYICELQQLHTILTGRYSLYDYVQRYTYEPFELVYDDELCLYTDGRLKFDIDSQGMMDTIIFDDMHYYIDSDVDSKLYDAIFMGVSQYDILDDDATKLLCMLYVIYNKLDVCKLSEYEHNATSLLVDSRQHMEISTHSIRRLFMACIPDTLPVFPNASVLCLRTLCECYCVVASNIKWLRLLQHDCDVTVAIRLSQMIYPNLILISFVGDSIITHSVHDGVPITELEALRYFASI